MPPILIASGLGHAQRRKSPEILRVTKKSNSIIVKRLSNVDSFIDALSKITLDLESRIEGVRTKGRMARNSQGHLNSGANLRKWFLVRSCSP